MSEHSVKGFSLRWNSASLNRACQTVHRGHTVNVSWTKDLTYPKEYKSFKVFITFGRLYNYFSNELAAQSIYGTLFCLWNCLPSLFTLRRRKSVPLLYTSETFQPKNSRAKFQVLPSSTHCTSSHGLVLNNFWSFQTKKYSFKGKKNCHHWHCTTGS